MCLSNSRPGIADGVLHTRSHHSGSVGCLSVLGLVPWLALVLSTLGRARSMEGIVLAAMCSHSFAGGGNVWEQHGKDRAWLPGEGWCPLTYQYHLGGGQWQALGVGAHCKRLSVCASAKLPCCSCWVEGIGEQSSPNMFCQLGSLEELLG